jgi:hypothetical protein
MKYYLPYTVLLLLISMLWAPPKLPYLGYVYPAGGQHGQEITVTVGGQHLKNVKAAMFDKQGLTAQVLYYKRVLSARQVRQYERRQRNITARLQSKKLQAKQRKRLKKRLKDIVQTLLQQGLKKNKKGRYIVKKDPKKQSNAQLAEQITLKINIDTQALPGKSELRLVDNQGVSNPVYFIVGQLPEKLEQERNQPWPQAKPIGDLPLTINGQILPGDEDCFMFSGRQGQQLVLKLQARQLVPYLADAVPGWFQAVMSVYDMQGQEMAYVDDYKFRPDPITVFKVPKDGKYIVRVRDSIYRGREDFVYRLTVGQLPLVTSVFPISFAQSAAVKLNLQGVNLAQKVLHLKTRNFIDQTPGQVLLWLPRNNIYLADYAIQVQNLPHVTEHESNDKQETANPVAIGRIINGQIQTPQDQDFFSFPGKAGQKIVLEVRARHLGSPLDGNVYLADAQGRVIAANDDWVDHGEGLCTHHADPYLNFALPHTGKYYVRLFDTQARGGPDFSYALRISEPQPDFDIRLTPSVLRLKRGGTTPVRVIVLARDGFAAAIKLHLQGPPGMELSPAQIPANVRQTVITIFCPRNIEAGNYRVSLSGTAPIKGRLVTRQVVPAEHRMQAFLYRHYVSTSDLFVCVKGRSWFKVGLKPPLSGVIKLTHNKAIKVPLVLPPLGKRAQKQLARVHLEVMEPQKGIIIEKAHLVPGQDPPYIELQARKSLKGKGGNLVFKGIWKKVWQNKKGQKRTRRRELFITCAVPFQVAP